MDVEQNEDPAKIGYFDVGTLNGEHAAYRQEYGPERPERYRGNAGEYQRKVDLAAAIAAHLKRNTHTIPEDDYAAKFSKQALAAVVLLQEVEGDLIPFLKQIALVYGTENLCVRRYSKQIDRTHYVLNYEDPEHYLVVIANVPIKPVFAQEQETENGLAGYGAFGVSTFDGAHWFVSTHIKWGAAGQDQTRRLCRSLAKQFFERGEIKSIVLGGDFNGPIPFVLGENGDQLRVEVDGQMKLADDLTDPDFPMQWLPLKRSVRISPSALSWLPHCSTDGKFITRPSSTDEHDKCIDHVFVWSKTPCFISAHQVHPMNEASDHEMVSVRVGLTNVV